MLRLPFSGRTRLVIYDGKEISFSFLFFKYIYIKETYQVNVGETPHRFPLFSLTAPNIITSFLYTSQRLKERGSRQIACSGLECELWVDPQHIGNCVGQQLRRCLMLVDGLEVAGLTLLSISLSPWGSKILNFLNSPPPPRNTTSLQRTPPFHVRLFIRIAPETVGE